MAIQNINQIAPSSATDREIRSIASSAGRGHSAHAMRIACLSTLTRQLIRKHETDTGTDLGQMLQMQSDCESAWADSHGLDPNDIEKAMLSLQRARITVEYLDSIPG